jgi:hypothetical protein
MKIICDVLHGTFRLNIYLAFSITLEVCQAIISQKRVKNGFIDKNVGFDK